MKTYKSIYSFYVIDKIKEGKTVYYVDRKLHDCGIINNISAQEYVTILKQSEEETTRYDFWIEEEKENPENE